MVKNTISIHKNYIILIIIVVLLFIVFGISYKYSQSQCQITKEDMDNKLKTMEENIKKIEEKNDNPQEITVVNTTPSLSPAINQDPRTLNSLDRIYNPLRYPYKSDYFYDQKWYPNLELPFQVVGCGGRNKPCLGGTQVPIYNPPTPIDISDNNIAPVYISTRGPLGQPQQVGIIYKVYGSDNEVYPLYGRRKYPNDNRYEYYTQMGYFGVKVPIVTKNKTEELGTNDIVFLKGKSDPYRVTIYKSDYPSYIPYL